MLFLVSLHVSMQKGFFRPDSQIKQTLCSSVMLLMDKAWTTICYRITNLGNLSGDRQTNFRLYYIDSK